MVAIVAAFLLQISSPTHGRVPGDGKPVNLVSCLSYEAAQLYAAMIRQASEAPPVGCVVLDEPFFPSPQLMADTVLVVGPLTDWEGDTFGVFEVTRASDGSKFYPFIWWAPRFSPIGMKI